MSSFATNPKVTENSTNSKEKSKLLQKLEISIFNEKNNLTYSINSTAYPEVLANNSFTPTNLNTTLSFNSDKEVTWDEVLAKFLLLFRQYLGLTQTEIASYLSLTAQQYQKYEGNKHPISDKKIQELFTGICQSGTFNMKLSLGVLSQMDVSW